MSYGDLQLARLACVALAIAILITAFGHSANWWHIERSIASLWWLGVLGFSGLFVVLGDRMPAALERERAEFARRKEEDRQKRLAAVAEQYERQKVAREKALAIARAEYPQHVDADALGERGWWEEDDGSDMVGMYLDPPEIVLKYETPGSDDDSEIRLYARERVEAAEGEREVKNHIRSILAGRERAAEAKRREEEQARLEAEYAAEEEEEKREQERRLAQQKVIRIDDRLK